MITLKVKQGATESILLLIHAGSAEDEVVYENILDCISTTTQFILAKDDNTFVYFQNFDYKAIVSSSNDLAVDGLDGLLLAAQSLQTDLPHSFKLLRDSSNRLLVNGVGRYIAVKQN